MRLAAIAAIIASCIGGAALAQQEDATSPQASTAPPHIVWEREPDPRAVFRRYLPHRAANERVSGAAMVCCTVRPDRRLDCTTAAEMPEGYGFGAATERAIEEYRMSEESYAEVQEMGYPFLMRRSMRWWLPGPTPELEAQFAAMTDPARELCTPDRAAETEEP